MEAHRAISSLHNTVLQRYSSLEAMLLGENKSVIQHLMESAMIFILLDAIGI